MRTEVDVRAYTLCVKAGVCRLEDVLTVGGYFNYGQPHRAGHPINGVSWFGAQRFCGWLGGRLPTEAEWEFLARGTDQRRFPWGDAPAGCADDRSARFHEGCPSDGTRPPGIHTVASAAGLAAMGGGVWEWVSDWYGAYSSMPLHDPTGPPNGAKRVQRGGAWSSDDPLERRASHRASMPPDSRLSDVGFRCVRDVR
jgi:formylglycine-generating enzyme required for sulfatase activity